MPTAKIKRWAICPECGSGLEFDGYRENELVCTGRGCDWSEGDSFHKTFTDLMMCPDCGSDRVEVEGQGYRENGVYCEDCGLEEGDFY